MATGSNTLTSYYAKRIEDQGIGTNTALTSLDNARVKILSNTASKYDTIWSAVSTGGKWASIIGPDNKFIQFYTNNAASNPSTIDMVTLDPGVNMVVDGRIYAGISGTTKASAVHARGAAGDIYLYSNDYTNSTNRGIYSFNHAGTGAGILTVDQSNQISGIATINGTVNITNTTSSSSTTTGALKVSGGIGAGGAIYAGSNIHAMSAGDTSITAHNTDKGTTVSLDAGGSGNLGVYTIGYYNGSSAVSSPGWLIYRGSDGVTRLPQSTAGATNIPVYIASGGVVTSCGNTLFRKVSKSVTYSCPANGVVTNLNAAPSLTGYSPAAVLSIETNCSDIVPRTWTAAGKFYLRNVSNVKVDNVNLVVTWLMVNNNLIS